MKNLSGPSLIKLSNYEEKKAKLMTTSSEIFGVTTVDETFNGCPVDDAKYCGDVIKSYGYHSLSRALDRARITINP